MSFLSVRIEKEWLDKLRSIAKYNGRSMNNEVVFLIRQAVINFEKEHGELEE